MARILILEPSTEIQHLLGRVLARLGHEAVYDDVGADDSLDVDAVVVEPAYPPGMGVAQAVRERRPDVPVICVSVEGRALSRPLSPVAHIQKPFSLVQLEHAVGAALTARA